MKLVVILLLLFSNLISLINMKISTMSNEDKKSGERKIILINSP